jgi:hypothetical protein
VTRVEGSSSSAQPPASSSKSGSVSTAALTVPSRVRSANAVH